MTMKKFLKNWRNIAQKKKERKNSGSDMDLSDDACLSVCSAGFDKDLEENDDEEISVDEEAPPIPEKKGQIFRKEIDTNICQIRYDKLEKLSDNLALKTYKCKKCNRIFLEEKKYNEHLSGCSKIKCVSCGKIFKDEDSFLNHLNFA